jgi:hypothetical protein
VEEDGLSFRPSSEEAAEPMPPPPRLRTISRLNNGPIASDPPLECCDLTQFIHPLHSKSYRALSMIRKSMPSGCDPMGGHRFSVEANKTRRGVCAEIMLKLKSEKRNAIRLNRHRCRIGGGFNARTGLEAAAWTAAPWSPLRSHGVSDG